MYCIRHVDKKPEEYIINIKEALHFNAYICSTAIYYEYFKYMHLDFFSFLIVAKNYVTILTCGFETSTWAGDIAEIDHSF
jgi:hypothetical protein